MRHVIMQVAIDKTIALLAEHGLDAYLIAADGWDWLGFDEFTLDPSGVRVLVDNGVVRTRRPWPRGFPVEELVNIRGGVGQ